MISNKPYLIRAFNEWIVDSVCTPIIVIDALHPRSKVPKDYIENGQVVFNISPDAIRDLKIMNESVEFKASFSGVVHIIFAPMSAILAIYAEENGEGIFFDGEDDDISDSDYAPVPVAEANPRSEAPLSAQEATAGKGKPFLRIVE